FFLPQTVFPGGKPGDPAHFIPGVRPSPNNSRNVRGINMVDIIGNFEAYAGLKQIVNGVFQPQPCLASRGISTNCFPVGSVATPNLRQDWAFTTTRNAIDGSSGGPGSPFGYFCDDLLGAWIITYHWYTAKGFGPGQTNTCKSKLASLAAAN